MCLLMFPVCFTHVSCVSEPFFLADKFMQKLGSVLHESQQSAIMERVNEVFQMVHAVYATH